MAEELTTWSPAAQMLNTAKKFAACPEEVSMAAEPPSSAQILAATWSFVGFWSRV
jgi:hypothetical protein